MSKRNDGGPAFPLDAEYQPDGVTEIRPAEPGMTLRDWFAGQALPAVISATSAGQHHPGSKSKLPPGSGTEVRLAFDAYALADAMLAERDRDGGS